MEHKTSYDLQDAGPYESLWFHKVRPYRDPNVLQKREDFVQSTYHNCCFSSQRVREKNYTTVASIADQQLPIIMAAPTVGQQKLHNTIAASIAGQPLSIIQHNIMAIFIANEKNVQSLLPLLISNYPSSWLSPLLANKTTQHHCCLPLLASH